MILSNVINELIGARTWLTVIRLPAYAPDLNPTRRCLGGSETRHHHHAIHGVDHLTRLDRPRLRACQQHTDLIAGFLAQTGMTLDPEPP